MNAPFSPQPPARLLATLTAIGALSLVVFACESKLTDAELKKEEKAKSTDIHLDSGAKEASKVAQPSPPSPPMLAMDAARSGDGIAHYNATAGMQASSPAYMSPPANTERYPDAKPNTVKVTAQEPVSTFSIDVDTASYGVVRRYLTDGTLPPPDAVRIEEMVNYFDYDYATPTDKSQPFATSVQILPAPWKKDTLLMHIGIKGYDIQKSVRPPANLVFLIDVSGSMQDENKLALVKKSLRMLVNELGEKDIVAMVVYAGAAGTVLEPTAGGDKRKILAAIDALDAGGSTAGGEGIRQAYTLAEQNFAKDKVNRIILATDGDFNVGITDPDALEGFVARKRESGIDLTVLGFGGGNYNDTMMQKLAQAGNGNAAYIDNLNEARKVLVDEMSSTLFTIAKDVKIQVEFNPQQVAEYRLVGYETRLLDRSDFNNDKVDAGDVGAGHSVTALYEITPVGSASRLTDPLRYGTPAPAAAKGDELAFVRVRYKLPGQDTSKLVEQPVAKSAIVAFDKAPEDIRFAAAVASFGEILRGGNHAGTLKLTDVRRMAEGAKGKDPFGYRAEFIGLVRTAESAQAMAPLPDPQKVMPN